jgi:hypothetical protein
MPDTESCPGQALIRHPESVDIGETCNMMICCHRIRLGITSKAAVLCILMLLYWGCSWMEPKEPPPEARPYYQKIKQWQKRIEKEGWSVALIDDVMYQSRRLTRYEMEFDDEWQTPGSFVRDGLRGDCEDIAFFMMGTLKQLGYPYLTRVLVIEDLFADHAQLKVELPDRSWKWYETTRRRAYYRQPQAWKPIVEFDEATIIYYTPSGSSQTASLR